LAKAGVAQQAGVMIFPAAMLHTVEVKQHAQPLPSSNSSTWFGDTCCLPWLP
jgi:hypothetical protein